MIRTYTKSWMDGDWSTTPSSTSIDPAECQFVLAFGSRNALSRPETFQELRGWFPRSRIIRVSTAGEIHGDQVKDGTITATGLAFEQTTQCYAAGNIRDFPNSWECGAALMGTLPMKDLRAVLVFSDGSLVNGSALAAGMNQANPLGVPVTGGMAGDGLAFARTCCGLDEELGEGNVVLIGLYGQEISVGHGSCGGWNEFGPERIVSYSESNVLYTIDGRSALSLYKELLGPHVKELPGSALLFPLSLRTDTTHKMLVRAITSIDETKESMTFAGSMPVGARVRLMRSTGEDLIKAAGTAAVDSLLSFGSTKPQFALLVSCVGRRQVLHERITEEIAAVRNIAGPNTCITGFYSYGELAPFAAQRGCDLHNQTMTITTMSEA